MSKAEQPTAFADLLKSISEIDETADLLVKSGMPAEDKKPTDDKVIDAAAKDSKDDPIDPDAQMLSKSLTVIGNDGKPVEMIDATEMLKSLNTEVQGHGTVFQKIFGVVSKQQDMIKSLQETVAKLGGNGTGRKSVVMAIDKPFIGQDMTKSAPAAEGVMNFEEFMVKSHAAYAAQKITGQELNTIDVCRRQGQAPSAELIRKVALS